MSIRDARRRTGKSCSGKTHTQSSRDVPAQCRTRVGKGSNNFDRLLNVKQRAEHPVCTSIAATPSSEATNDVYRRYSFDMQACKQPELVLRNHFHTNPPGDRGKAHAHAYIVDDTGAPLRRPSENPLKRCRDNLANAPTAKVILDSALDVLKKQRDSIDSDFYASEWNGIEGLPHKRLSGLGLSLQPPPQFSSGRPVSLISPRTSKKIRRLPKPGKTERDLLQVSM